MGKINEVPGKVSFGRAFKDFFIGYIDFKGRTTRAGYWWMTLILTILSFIPIIFFVYLAIGSAMSISGGANESDVFTSILGSFIIPLMILVIAWLALFLPSLAMAVRRYRDAGLRGRGFLVLWVISIASSYTEATSVLQHNNGSALFIFLAYAIGLLFFILTVLPANAIATKSNNDFVRFFLREKEEL
ncbi:hypothetical protein IGI95_002650 [Enterococcus sp. DIV0784]|uniref:DUF805 domain-containing protein n=1 Tax=unclassified Enterococcus TaxID=2608891 RepID=UPI003F29CFE9